MNKDYKSTKFLNYEIAITPATRLLKKLTDQVGFGKKLLVVFTPNPEQLVYAKSHSWFDKVLGKSDILLPDGVGIVIGSQIVSFFDKSVPVTQRIAGVDVVAKLLDTLTDKKILIVGGREYAGLSYQGWMVMQACAKTSTLQPVPTKLTKTVEQSVNKQVKLKKQQHLFWHEGFLNITQPTQTEKNELLECIQTLKPEVIFVAFGAPHQEQWIIENKQVLEASGVRLAMVVGGAFDMLLGKVSRAPKWMQKVGLEWLFRLYQEPWRWKRQIKLLQFVKLVVQASLK